MLRTYKLQEKNAHKRLQEWERKKQYLFDNQFAKTDYGITSEQAKKLYSNMIELYQNLAKRYHDSILECETFIRSRKPREEEILRLRYNDGLGWRKISQIMNYEESYCRRIHNNALKNYNNIQ